VILTVQLGGLNSPLNTHTFHFCHAACGMDTKYCDEYVRLSNCISQQEGLAVASIVRDVGSSSTNHSSDIMH